MRGKSCSGIKIDLMSESQPPPGYSEPEISTDGSVISWLSSCGDRVVFRTSFATSARMLDHDGMFELVIGNAPDKCRIFLWRSPLASGFNDDAIERRYQESCGRIIAAVSSRYRSRKRESVMSDRRCVTGPPHRFPTTDIWKLSHIESRGHIWGTETSIDAPEVLAAGSVVACIWPLPNVLPVPSVFCRPGREDGIVA